MASFPSWFLGGSTQSKEDIDTVQLLLNLKQEHVLGTPPTTSSDTSTATLVDPKVLAERRSLLAQVRVLDGKYPGGLKAYVLKSRKLLQDARTGINPFLKLRPSQPDCEVLPFAGDAFFDAEQIGLQEASSACFVLVAGGLGERLGFSGIKLALPTETCTMTCFLELFAHNLLSIQNNANKGSEFSSGETTTNPVQIPLLIMTSNDTHERTQELLHTNNYFGLDPSQVNVLMQDKVASIQDMNGRFAIDPSSPSSCPPILTKPHGHGDVHLLLHQSGIARKWLSQGKRWIVFFQDTNANVFRTLIPGIGVSALRKFGGNFVAVPRKAKSASGAIMKMTNPKGNSDDDDASRTLNVEYNYVEDVLLEHGFSEGDVNVPSKVEEAGNSLGGYSAFPGNTNQLVIALDVYVPALDASSGLVPEFVNPKYSDEEKLKFKPTRIECMMQDIFQLFPHSTNVGVTVFEDYTEERTLTHRLYCPVKNNLTDAATKASKHVPSCSAIAGELAVYAANACVMRCMGAQIGSPVSRSFGGINVKCWPKMVFFPSFAIGYGPLRTKCFPNLNRIKVSARSTLVVEGDVTFEELDLDGTLVLRCVPGARVVVKKAMIKNEGWDMLPLTGEEDVQFQQEVFKIRGCYIAKEGRDICQVTISSPGDHEIELPLSTETTTPTAKKRRTLNESD